MFCTLDDYISNSFTDLSAVDWKLHTCVFVSIFFLPSLMDLLSVSWSWVFPLYHGKARRMEISISLPLRSFRPYG